MLQTGEILVILLLALIVLGPTRLPDMARKLGRWTAELRASAREITRGLEAEVADFKEVGRELKAPMDEVKKPFTEIRGEMSGFGPKGHEWKGPKPVSGPTPEDAMRDLEEINEGVEETGPSASPPPSPDGDTSPNASLEEETTRSDGPSALGEETGPSASPPPSPDGDTSPNASLGEETGDRDETEE